MEAVHRIAQPVALAALMGLMDTQENKVTFITAIKVKVMEKQPGNLVIVRHGNTLPVVVVDLTIRMAAPAVNPAEVMAHLTKEMQHLEKKILAPAAVAVIKEKVEAES